MAKSFLDLPQNLHALLRRNPERLRQAFAGWSVVLMGLLVERGLVTLTLIIVARQTSAIEYGQYLSSYALLSLLVVLPSSGIDAWLLVEGGRDHSRTAALWNSVFRLRLLFIAAWTTAAAVLGLFLAPQTFPAAVYYPTILVVGAESLVLLSFAALRSIGQNIRVAVLQIFSALALLSVTLALGLQAGDIARFSASRAVIACGVAIIVVGLNYLYWRTAGSLPAPVSASARQILRQARPFLWGDLATSIYLRADLTIVAFFLGSLGSSIYGPALNFTNMSFLVPNALYFVVVPLLASYTKTRRSLFRPGLVQLVFQAGVGLMMALGTFFLAGPLIRFIFGPGYEASAGVLRMLSPVLFLKSINFGLAAILVAGNEQKQRARVQASSAVFSILANLAVIVPFGLPGVAAVYALSEAVLVGGYSRIAAGWFSKQEADLPR